MALALDGLDAFDQGVARELSASVPGLVAAYRFGSSTRHELRSDSDIDVAFLSWARMLPLARFDLQERLARLAGRDVDLIELREASTVLRKEVISSGELVLDALPTERALFEAHCLSDYARLNEERAGILEDISMRGRIHG